MTKWIQMTRFSTDRMKVKLGVFFFLNDFCVEIRMFFYHQTDNRFWETAVAYGKLSWRWKRHDIFTSRYLSLKFVFQAHRVKRAFENTILLTNLDNTIFIVLVPLRAICAKSQRVWFHPAFLFLLNLFTTDRRKALRGDLGNRAKQEWWDSDPFI